MVRIESALRLNALEWADKAGQALCVVLMVVIPYVLLFGSVALCADNTAASLVVVPFAAATSVATFWWGMMAFKTTSKRIKRRLQDRLLGPWTRRAQVLDLAFLADRNVCIQSVRVLDDVMGNVIEITTQDGETLRVFEQLTPDETALIVDALESRTS